MTDRMIDDCFSDGGCRDEITDRYAHQLTELVMLVGAMFFTALLEGI